ncbi:hypothetical protein HF086_009515, partial [Spodoptera exigua]
MDYKKYYDNSLQRLQEALCSRDKRYCCHLIPTPEEEKINLGTSFNKALTCSNPGKKRRNVGGRRGVDIPLGFAKGEQKVYYTGKEMVKRKSSCVGYGCFTKENIPPKNSFADIYLSGPELDPIYPYHTDGAVEKTKQLNKIKMLIERAIIDPDSENSEISLLNHKQQKIVRE